MFQENKPTLKEISEIGKKTALYELTFEMIKNLAQFTSEEKVINKIFEIIKSLFSPKTIVYISITNNKITAIKTVPPNIKKTEISLEKLNSIGENYYLCDTKRSFILKITHSNELLGFIEINEIEYPQYLIRYLNIAIVISRICGLSIANARTYQKLNKTLDKLKVSNKDLKQFAHIISHDLKQPLTKMILSLEMLKFNINGDSNLKHVNDVEKSAFNLNSMIDKILELSTYGYRNENIKKIDCNKVLKQVLENLSFKIEKRNAIITYEGLPTIYANEMELIQLFQNFIDNGIKYNEKKTPEIHISAEKVGVDWLFSIKDNGMGIDSMNFNMIFEPFKRIDNGTKESGSGIGLSICKRIVERLEGRLWLDSELEKGSIFYFKIPIKENIL